MMTFEDFLNAIRREMRFDRDLEISYKVVSDLSYERYGDELGEFKRIYREKFLPEYKKLCGMLERKGVDVSRLKARSFRRFAVEVFSNEVDLTKIWYIVYGETMGFLTEDGENWRLFEGSDEPGELDMYLYRKLVCGEGRKLVLYGMHGRDFVESWLVTGIPEGVYFSTDKSIAERYWHMGGDDVLVKVRMPLDAVVETADKEYRTVRRVDPGEFVLLS